MTNEPTVPTPWGETITLDAYYRTPHWVETAVAARRSAGYLCEDCGVGNQALHVHHLHYDTLWEEGAEDLRVLCESCHVAADEDRRRVKGIRTFMVKKYGRDWSSRLTWADAEEDFDEWLLKKAPVS